MSSRGKTVATYNRAALLRKVRAWREQPTEADRRRFTMANQPPVGQRRCGRCSRRLEAWQMSWQDVARALEAGKEIPRIIETPDCERCRPAGVTADGGSRAAGSVLTEA